jgi:hypothetical protein
MFRRVAPSGRTILFRNLPGDLGGARRAVYEALKSGRLMLPDDEKEALLQGFEQQ